MKLTRANDIKSLGVVTRRYHSEVPKMTKNHPKSPLGGLPGRPGRILARFAALWDRLGASWGRLESVVGASWGVMGRD